MVILSSDRTARPRGIAATPDGGFVVVGRTSGALPLTATGPLGSSVPSITKPAFAGAPVYAAFVARYGPGGVPEWIAEVANTDVAAQDFFTQTVGVTFVAPEDGSKDSNGKMGKMGMAGPAGEIVVTVSLLASAVFLHLLASALRSLALLMAGHLARSCLAVAASRVICLSTSPAALGR